VAAAGKSGRRQGEREKRKLRVKNTRGFQRKFHFPRLLGVIGGRYWGLFYLTGFLALSLRRLVGGGLFFVDFFDLLFNKKTPADRGYG
jgi:hypothetical protein